MDKVYVVMCTHSMAEGDYMGYAEVNIIGVYTSEEQARTVEREHRELNHGAHPVSVEMRPVIVNRVWHYMGNTDIPY